MQYGWIKKGCGPPVFSLTAIILSLYFTIANGQVQNRITGGEPVTTNEFPFLVSLWRDNAATFFCGGSILNSQWILTAAHCLTVPANQIEAVAGSLNLNVPSLSVQRTRIEEYFIHPDYNNLTSENDIAVLRTEFDFTLNLDVQRVGLEPPGYIKDNQATIVGWGRLQFTGEVSPVLQKATVPIFDQQRCATIYAEANAPTPVRDTMICAGGDEKGICNGDSGSPLICTSPCGMESVQCGIASFGLGDVCARPGVPDVFTRVTPFLDFIITTVGTNSRVPRPRP